MAGYLGTKAVLLSTTAADVTGNAEIGGSLTVGGNLTSTGIDDNAAATAVTIDSSQNVGIGTTDTTSEGQAGKLKVRNDVDYSSAEFEDNATLVLQNETDNHSAVIVFHSDNGSNSSKRAGIVGGNINSNTSALGFYGDISNKTAATKPDVLIDSSGRISMGTSFSSSLGQYFQVVNNNAANQGSNDCLAYLETAADDWNLKLSQTGQSASYFIRFYTQGTDVGAITGNTTSTTYATSSDYRLKTDAQPMTRASARVQALRPVNFEWIANGTRVDGFLAHEAQAVVPESVTGTKDAMRDEEYEVTPAVLDDDGNETTAAVMGTRSVPDYQGIDQSKLVPLLTAALQEALTKIDTMETRLAALEGN